jgi:hypothetical protein
MATNIKTKSKRTLTPLQQITPPVGEDTTTLSHPPLQYDDPQRFRDYARLINFDDDDFSADDMFANPPPLPELEILSII